MGAMEFEYLLRRIYQVGRYGTKGADADIYRDMEHSKYLYQEEIENLKNKQPRLRNQSIEDLEYEYRVECRKIWSYVVEAIKKGIDKYSSILSDEEIKKLEDCIKEKSEITSEFIDERIKIAQDIFVAHEIYPK